MPRFELKQSNRHLTSYAGFALIGQCFEAAQVERLDLLFPTTSQGMKIPDMVKSYVGLLSLGKSDFEAIKAFREDRLLMRTHPGCALRTSAHSFKTDLDLERLLSGKVMLGNPCPAPCGRSACKSAPGGFVDCNDLVVHLGQFAYNCLRLIGQLGLTGELSPMRHPAKRRRLKTVLQEIMYRAAQFIRKARKLILDFWQHCPAFAAFAHVQTDCWKLGSRRERQAFRAKPKESNR